MSVCLKINSKNKKYLFVEYDPDIWYNYCHKSVEAGKAKHDIIYNKSATL